MSATFLRTRKDRVYSKRWEIAVKIWEYVSLILFVVFEICLPPFIFLFIIYLQEYY